MKITILGSTGFVGGVLLQKALAQGYQVKTLVRDPAKLGPVADKVEIIKGTAAEEDKLEQSMAGVDAVVSTLPPTSKVKKPQEYTLAMEKIVAALEKNNVKRFIHIGGAVHGGGSDEIWSRERRLLRFYLNLVCKPVLIAKEYEWNVLRESGLNWTLVRPPRIVDGAPRGPFVADEKNLASVQVNVEDLADFILQQIDSSQWLGKAPLVANKSK